MTTLRAFIIVLVLLPAALLSAQQTKDVPDRLNLQGDLAGEITQHDAMMLDFHVPMLVDRIRKSGRAIPEAVDKLLSAARDAYGRNDYYRAFRLYARAAGLAQGESKVESYEVAASLKLSLNRAIFDHGESITVAVRPQFTLGHSLANRYSIHSWLETETGIISNSNKQLVISDLKEYDFEYPTSTLPDGIIAVGYRLTSPDNETLAELRQAIVVAKDVQKRLERLRDNFQALTAPGVADRSAAFLTALDTIEYNIQNLEQERRTFSGNWRRAAHPFGMYLGHVNFVAIGRETGNPAPQFNARLRYPVDVDFTESLAGSLRADHDAILKQSGDMAQVYRSAKGELLRYRIFVPGEHDRARKYSMIVALHSGAGDSSYFEWENSFASPGQHPENRFKQLAQERGYIVVCPNGASSGFLQERDYPEIVALTNKLRTMYSIDQNHVFLAGWSVGASAAWKIAMDNPEVFRGLASVGGEADWLDRQNAQRALDLPVLYSVPDEEAAQAQRTVTLAKQLLRNFSYVEYPQTDHVGVWSKALPGVFDFFGAQTSGSPHVGHGDRSDKSGARDTGKTSDPVIPNRVD